MREADLLTPDVVNACKLATLRRYPEEACGIVRANGQFEEVENVAASVGLDPTKHSVPPRGLFAEGIIRSDILAYFHSHPDGPNCPSEQDMIEQQRHALPFIICAAKAGAVAPPFAWGDQLERPALTQRAFRHGVNDCYSAVRDHARQELGRSMSNYPRGWEWWRQGKNLYMENFLSEGYQLVEREVPLEVGDVFLFSVNVEVYVQGECKVFEVIGHAGVICSKGKMLHHRVDGRPWDEACLSEIVASAPYERLRPLRVRYYAQDH